MRPCARVPSQDDLWNSFYRANGRAWRGSCRLPPGLGAGGRALDAGCGSGKSACSLLDMGFEVFGVDSSEEAVGLCRRRFGDRAEFVKADVLALPFPDGFFDAAAAVHLLEHLPDGDLGGAFSELRRVLRPGGALFVRDFAPGDLRSGPRENSDILYVHRDPGDLLGRATGFDVLSAEVVEEATRFGGARVRTELLLRRNR